MSSGGQESKCQVDDMSRREDKELAKTNLKKMGKTMQKLQHIGSIKDLRPKNPFWLMFVLGSIHLLQTIVFHAEVVSFLRVL